MRAFPLALCCIASALTAATVPACVSDRTDGVAATECQADRLPTDGTTCDPVKNPAGTFCRLGSCGWGTEAECACMSGRWSCSLSHRDDYGCGPPPFCREKTSPSCDECAFHGGACLAPKPGVTCCEQPGTAYDEARDCTYGLQQAVACAPEPLAPTNACSMTGAIDCVITNDGTTRRVWKVPGLIGGWNAPEKCSAELRARVLDA
ncbi:MAG: hypothetical protein HYV09_32350 [Deltaproteobacteria bacterium]|nr:hypothetical protein [Deltaproteobacteria bacterium]